MRAIPSGASGTGTSHRWIRNRFPGIHSKLTRAPASVGGMSLNLATILHSPTSGARASIKSVLLVSAIFYLLRLGSRWIFIFRRGRVVDCQLSESLPMFECRLQQDKNSRSHPLDEALRCAVSIAPMGGASDDANSSPSIESPS